jgi:GTP-binding protein EngB required for normal cell division
MSSNDLLLVVVVLIAVGLVIARLLRSPEKPKPLTVLVCGATGVGKSTLINTLVRRSAAQTGIGTPVTQNTVRIESPSGEMAFYDSKGLEVEDASQTYLLLLSDLLKLRFGSSAGKHIDIVLMCIQEPQGRIDDAHLEIAGLCEDLRIPLAIAITKTEGNPDLEKAVRERFPRAVFVRRVRSLELRIGSVTIPAEGLEELVGEMKAAVSPNVRDGKRRARAGRKAQHLAHIARRLAANGTNDDSAWIAFGAASWKHLEIKGAKWNDLVSSLRRDIRKSLVPGFLRRNFNTSFDNRRIDAAVVRRLLPVVIRRFGDESRTIPAGDIQQIKCEATAILAQSRPYRSRFS